MRTKADGLLGEILEYIDQRVDIRDGDDGQPMPNAWMTLNQMMEEWQDQVKKEARDFSVGLYAPWPERAMELLRAAQDVAADGTMHGPEDHVSTYVFAVDEPIFRALYDIVHEIGDEAAAQIKKGGI